MSEHFLNFFFLSSFQQMRNANAMVGLTNVLCNHCAPICYWQTPNYWSRCPFSMNANKTWCKSRFFFFDANAFLEGCKCEMSIWCTCLLSEVQFSWCKCPMRWCKCNVYPWWCQRTYLPMMQMSPYKDGDAKCLVVQMSSNGHVMMQMLLVGMSWCKCPLGVCHDANVHLWVCHDVNAPLWVCHDANVHVGMPWCKCLCKYVMM